MEDPRCSLVVAYSAAVMRQPDDARRDARTTLIRLSVRGRLLIPKRSAVLAVGLLLIAAASLAAHDLFLKPDAFFLAPNSAVAVRVMSGTFVKSENAVTTDRLLDVSVVTPDGRAHPDTSAWRDRGDTSVLTFRTGRSGTYLVGASTRPRVLALAGKQFNQYLASDGVPDVLEARRKAGELEKPSRERYSKHVKALLQVGDTRTDGYATVLGYPAELVPLDNPYTLRVGGTLRVRALVDGKPSVKQLIVAGGRTAPGTRIAQRSTRTDADGLARISLASRGQWYVKFIHMVPVTGDSVTYESKWATLTFEVR